MKQFILVMNIILLASSFALAQSDEYAVNVSGQIRFRTSWDNIDFNKETDMYNYSLLRTRLNIKATLSDRVIAFAQLQDSRNFGSEDTTAATSTQKSLANIDLHQGYIQINQLFWHWFSTKLGRMEMGYGGERLLGTNQWSNVGRAFDGAIFSLKFRLIQIDLFTANLYEFMHEPTISDGDQALYGIWSMANFVKPHTLEFYILHDVDRQKNEDENCRLKRSTAGIRFKSKWNFVNMETEFDYQTGKKNYVQDISAFYFISAVDYTFNMAFKPSFGLGFDYLSGDKSSTDKYECFNTLYPAKHRFFGYMDYFTDIPKHTKNLGLSDMMAKISIQPKNNLKLKGDLHLFNLAQNAVLSDGVSSKKLGTEFDITVDYNYLKSVNFQLGGAFFLPGDVFKDWKGKDNSWWFYGQTTVSF